MLKLPSYQQLSEEQDAVNNLPLTGHHLVVGPPGTGKSVMAIYRASMFSRVGRSCTFLVYNRPLQQYVEQMVKASKLQVSVSTLHSWIPFWYKTNFGAEIPKIDRWNFDWLNAQMEAIKRPLKRRIPNVIVDEGQDFPQDFYRFLLLVAETITVFADENQRLWENNSTVDEIRRMLGISANDVRYLTRNYRNSREIASFASGFYSGLASGVPNLPERRGQVPAVISSVGLKDQVAMVRKIAELFPSAAIGVFLPKQSHQWAFHKALRECDPTIPVQIFDSRSRNARTLDFSKAGITILNQHTAKGLEFDIVVVGCLEAMTESAESDLTRMRFYVLSSRARDRLFLMTADSANPRILQGVSSESYRILAPAQ